MAEKEEGPIVDNEVGSLKVKEKTEKQPDGNETKGDITKVKEKMKMKSQVIEESVTKIDLNKPTKPEEDETKKDNTNDKGVVGESKDANTAQEQKEVQSKTETQEAPVLEEITSTKETKEEVVESTPEEVIETIKEAEATGEPLPENIQKLVDFMSETGGDLNDYVKLNQDYSDLDSQDLLYEYYKQTKPHLNAEEINFLMEDQFSYDEDRDEEKDVKRKKLALKEQVANAKSHLDGLKSKYYEDIKAGSKLTSEQQKAIDFFNRYNEEEAKNKEGNEKRVSNFKEKTKNVFNDKFKGFEYSIGDKRFRYNVQDAEKVKDTQSDISNFIGKFLDKDQNMNDAEGYHKSLFTAMNPDAIAKHFYEQGQADALRESVAKGKNIDMEPRQAHGEVQAGGVKVRVLGDDTSDFKFKIKNKNNN